MKRREIQALCRRHGLPAGGSNADLVARLDAALSGAGDAEEEVAVVPARKGCLKQTGGDAAVEKKVTFGVEEGPARRLRSRVVWSPVAAKTRRKSAQASTDSAAAEDSISAEVRAIAPVRRSRRNSMAAVDTEDVGEAVAVDRKRKRKNQENDEGVTVSAQVASRVTRRSSLAVAADVLPPVIEKKRGRGKATGRSNELAAEAQDCETDVHKSSQVEVSARITRSHATAAVVMPPAVVENKRRKTRDAQTNVLLSTVPDALPPAVEKKRGRGKATGGSSKLASEAQDCEADAQNSAQVEVSARVTRSRATAAAVMSPTVVEKKRRMTGNAQTNVELSTALDVLPSAVEKRRGKGKATGGSNKLAAEVQDCEPDVPNSAQVQVSAQITRSRATAAVVMSPTVVENKRRKTRDAHTNVELSTVPDVPRNDAPVTRSLRSRVVQANNNMEDETHTARQLENKVQPSRPQTRRSQPVSSSAEGKNQEQTAVPNKAPLLRRSGRNYSEDVEQQPAVKEPVKRSTRKSIVLVKDTKDIGEEIRNASSQVAEKQLATKGPVRGLRRKSVASELHEKEKGLIAEKNLEAYNGKSMRKPVMPVKDIKAVGEGIQNGKGKDVEKQFVVKQPTRRSSRKSVLPDVLGNNSGILAAEMNAETNVRRSTQKSVLPNMLNEENRDHKKRARNDNFQSGKCQDDERQAKQTTASEEVRSAKEATDDIIIGEATKNAHEATHEYKESGSTVQEFVQVNATREEHSSGPLLVTVTLTDEISTAQSVPVVIPWSECGDNGKSKQEHSDILAVGSHLSETSLALDESSCIAGQVPNNFVVSEDKALVSKDGLSINFNVGDCEEQRPISKDGRVGLEANASEYGKNLADIMSTGLYAKSLQHDTGIIAEDSGKVLEAALLISKSDTSPEIHCIAVAEESIRAADLGKCPSRSGVWNPLSTSLHLEGVADDTSLPELNGDKGWSPDGRRSSFDLELILTEESKESYSINVENTAVEIDGADKPSTPGTPDFYVGTDRLEDGDVQPTECDADNKLDVDQGVAEEEVLAPEKSSDQHVPAKIDLNMKLKDESITEKNTRLFVDNLDQQAIFKVQQGDVQEGDLKEPSPCSTTPKCKHKCGLPEETVFPAKNMGSLSSAEQSPCGLESLFSQENIDESMGSAAAHTKKGIDDSKDCHVKSVLENTHAEEGISRNDDCMQTSQQDNGMEGLPESNLDEERVLSVFSMDGKHIEVINFEEVACEGEGCKKPVDSEELKASSEKTNVNVPDGNAYGITDAVLSSALHTPANDSYEICLGSATDVVHQDHNDQCSDDTEDIIEDASAEYIERGMVLLSAKERSNLKDEQHNSGLEGAKVVESGLYSVGEITPSGSGLSKDSSMEYRQEVLVGVSMKTSLDGSSTCGEKNVCRVDAIDNPSIGLATPGCKHEDALSDEAVCTMKNYAGTCSSNPREVFMELQSLSSKRNLKESDPHDVLAFPNAENSGDESINVQHRVNVHHGSDLSHLGSTDLLDELIGCSNTELLCLGHNHIDRSNVDRAEQVASEPCANNMLESAADAKCIKSGLLLLPSEERSNFDDGQFNPKLESPNIIGPGLNWDNDICNTSDNGSAVVVVSKRTPSSSGLPEDYPKDHNPQQELLDGVSVESSLEHTIFGKKIVSGIAGIGNPTTSSNAGIGNPTSLDATPDSKYEGALSKDTVCRMKNYTGMCSADPKHLLMDPQSLYSEGSAEKSDLQDNLAFGSVDPKHLLMGLQSPYSEGSAEKSDLQDNLAFSSASGRDEPIVYHVEKLVDTQVSSEPDTYHGPCQDLSRCEEKESCMSVPMQVKESGGFLRSMHMKGSLTSAQIDLADGAPLIERDLVGPVEMLGEEKVERKSMPTSDSDILQEKSYSDGHGICQSCSQKHAVEANSRLSSCGTKVLCQDHIEECKKPNEGKCSPKALVENNMTEDAANKGMESSIMWPLVAETSEIPYEQLNTKMSDESKELIFSCDKDTNENFCTGPAQRDLYPLPKDFHIDSCQKQEVPEVLSLTKSPEESSIFDTVSVSGSGPCQYRVNGSTSMQVTSNVEMLNQDHEEYNQINDDQTTPGILGSSINGSTSMQAQVAYNIETLNQDHEEYNRNSDDQTTPGILGISVPEAAEIEHSEIEIGLIPAAEASVLPVPDKQLNDKLEGNEVYEQSCSNDKDKDLSSLSDIEFLNREAFNLHKDDCMDLSSEDNHPDDLPAPRSPEQSACFQNNNDSGASQQRVNGSTSMQATYNIETLNQDHEEYNRNNADPTTPGILGISVPEAVEIEQSEMEIGLIPAAEASVLPVPDEQLNDKLEGNEVFEQSCSYDKDKDLSSLSDTEFFNREASNLHKDDCMEMSGEDKLPNDIPPPRSPEQSACFQNNNDSGASQQRVNGSTSMQVTYNIETVNQDHEEYNENNDDETTPGILGSSVPEAVEIEQSETEMGLITAAEALLPVANELLNNKLEGNEVYEQSCSCDKAKDLSSISDTEFLSREASSLHKDDCVDLLSEDDHPNDLPSPRSPEEPACFQNNVNSGSVGSCQSSRQSGIAELRAKLQSFKVSSTVKESYIAMSAPRPKPVDSMSQSAIALLRNIENTPAVKAVHPPVKPNADGKDSSRRALQPISGRPREH